MCHHRGRPLRGHRSNQRPHHSRCVCCYIVVYVLLIVFVGGENISPVEVEGRLLEHGSIAEACVVGIKDEKYGEVVGCFLRQAGNSCRLSTEEVAQWVRQRLGSHKSPQHVFWIGDPEVGLDYPKTGSGKHQKHILRVHGEQLVTKSRRNVKL